MKSKLFIFFFVIFGLLSIEAQQKHSFSYNDNDFLLDGKPFQMISGEIHYPRVPKEVLPQKNRRHLFGYEQLGKRCGLGECK